MIDRSIASFPLNCPVILIAVLNIGINHHPLCTHCLDVSWSRVFKDLLRTWLFMDRLYTRDKFLQLRSVLPATNHPISSLVDSLMKSCYLLLAKICLLTLKHLEVIPVRNFHIEIKVNTPILLHHKQSQYISPLNNGVVLMPNVIFLCKYLFSLWT